jgi:calcium-dependent protein kinase
MGNCCLHDRPKYPQSSKSPRSKPKNTLLGPSLTYPTNINNDFELHELISSGGFGKVYAGKNKNNNEKVAIKCISKENNAGRIEQVHSEIELLSSTDHPNIIRLYGVYEDITRFYLVMEYCSGGDLSQKIQHKKEFDLLYTEKDVVRYMKHILRCLCYLHTRNISHRDVTPSNFLIIKSKDKFKLKLIDFGLSQHVHKVTVCPEVIGTARFMAPEAIEGEIHLASDIWSAGVIMYLLICGSYPFDGHDKATLFRKIKTDKLKFKQPMWENVSTEAKTLLNKLLTKSPYERISAFDALKDEWFEKSKESSTPNINNSRILSSFRKFNATNPLKVEILGWIAKHIHSSKIDELTEIFYQFDINNTGDISYHTFSSTLNKAGIKIKKKNLKELFDRVDTSKDGSINFTEFISSMLFSSNLLSETVIRQTFSEFDADKDGFITQEEIINKFRKALKVTPEDEAWLRGVDLNGDGKISLEEFRKMILG